MEDNSHMRENYTIYIHMNQVHKLYNSHMRENYTNHVFTVHEYIYRVVSFAFISHKRDFGVENIINSHRRENYRNGTFDGR